MSTENTTTHEAASNTTNVAPDNVTQTAAFFDPLWQLAASIEFYFQCAIIASGIFGTVANALVLYTLIEFHVRQVKKRQVNLLLINQNLLDLLSCVLFVVTFSLRASNIYLSGALGYFLCTIFISANSSNSMIYASVINLMPASPKCLFVKNTPYRY